MLSAAIEALAAQKNEKYIDATAGEGGHLAALVESGAQVLAIDADPSQLQRLKNTYEHNTRITLATGNFAHIEEIATKYGFLGAAGIIIDLGLSMRQLKDAKKGFSYKETGDILDMRLIEGASLAASDLLNTKAMEELEDLIGRYGEEPQAAAIAAAIVDMRRTRKIEKVGDLVFCIDRAVGVGRDDVYRRVFQALRIAVNSELENLRGALAGGMRTLKEEGRLVVISFHSLEDRIVKEFVRSRRLATLTKKPITNRRGPSFERAAKMRVIINKKVH